MKEFYLELEGGQLRIVKEGDQLKFEAGALHLEKKKVTTVTFFLNENDINELGEWLNNVKIQEQD